MNRTVAQQPPSPLGAAAHRFALLGGPPAFDAMLPVGQLYFPSLERYEQSMRGIFERGYYTNHGPLIAEFERRLADKLGVRHAICVTNATIGLIIAALALQLRGKVIVPSFTFLASAQSLTWAGLEPVFCDVDPRTCLMTPELVEPLIDDDVSAILGVNLWGGACDPVGLERLAERHGIPVYFDSAHGFGCSVGGKPLGGFGALEVFSFHATKVLNATEGGCVCTNYDDVAARLRSMRSSYGIDAPARVPATLNGRFSEAQAAVGLMSLEDFEANRDHNRRLYERYREKLRGIAGIEVVEADGVDRTNYQYVVCRVDEARLGLGRDELARTLKAENLNVRRYFHPGTHRSIPYDTQLPQYRDRLPATDLLCRTLIQFPIGALVEPDDVDKIVALIASVPARAGDLRRALAQPVS
ncbi:MAG TPA: aminotransferase class I/II-fold pyridoxal phosphate-dependent enzyme [Burkholderiaceae bacterium]|nr:aminotransferase class I/II-fold pyridoxal phosphate-dependent enzyme [Burkholderiaceae bacterium]